MPTIPSYEPRARQQPLPGIRYTTDAPAPAFGLGRTVEGAYAQAGAGAAEQRAHEERMLREADQVGAMDAELRLAQAQNALLYDQKEGALTRRGKDVGGLDIEYNAKLAKVADEIGNGLATEGQRKAFARVRAHRIANFDETLKRHMFGETTRFDEETTERMIEQAGQDALSRYDDPNEVAFALGRQYAAYADHAKRNGKDQAWIDWKTAQANQRVHLGILDRMLVNGQDLKAQKYFDENKVGFGDRAGDAEKALEVGSREAVAARFVNAMDEGMAEPSGNGNNWTMTAPFKTIGDLRSKMPKEWDEKTRAIAVRMGKERLAERDEAKEQREHEIWTAMWNDITAGKPVNQIEKMALEPKRQQSLDAHAANVAKGKLRTESDPRAFAAFHALTDRDLRSMPLRDLVEGLKPMLTQEHYDAAAKKWGAARSDPAKYKSVYSDDEQILRGFQNTGIGGVKQGEAMTSIQKDDGKSAGFMRFKDAVEAAKLQYFNKHKENPEPEEFKKIVADVAFNLSKEITTTNVPMYEWNSRLGDMLGYSKDESRMGLAVGRGTITKKLGELLPEDIKGRQVVVPREYVMDLYKEAKSMGAVPYGWDLRAWQQHAQDRINASWIAGQMGADEQTKRKILLGIK